MNVLFICSMNKWRSPTAEAIFQKQPGISVRSGGTSQKAKRRVRLDDIHWADVICVMEEKHLARLRADFRQDMIHKSTHVLDIPDDYRFMDPELVEILDQAVSPIIGVD